MSNVQCMLHAFKKDHFLYHSINARKIFLFRSFDLDLMDWCPHQGIDKGSHGKDKNSVKVSEQISLRWKD